ncbi:histone acetyltransferase type B catalytic subunit [Fomitopsis serialis]|uniref:histone acetyltransferase type B catalytic subunit n=1 Tax=Fomitopsis serialis TaxID=139415 RepID=UPI00200732FA|nr:histone acetyltransferase type B catalytic subunit [Neoantrodia serialis]KAH9934953.1 histone acetyltransferase type B catalytic subunit [Neoantrodia serialis]
MAATDAHLWAADANEAIHLSLVRAAADKASLNAREHYEGFNPCYTYPLFGEDEKIYGYRDLRIDLKFASGSLAQYLSVQHTDKLPATSAVDDIVGAISKFIPPGYYTDEAAFLKRVEEDAITFRPPGTRIHSYSRPSTGGKGKEKVVREDEDAIDFEVYQCTWDTPGFRELHRRMQLFILLYIDGGSYIREDEDVWQFVVLYEKRKRRSDPSVSTYHFVGYSTLYPFYCFPEKVRLRLSQFIIVPPYQQEGHGSALYSAIYRYIRDAPDIAELTVEDPVEAFEDLRDRNDLKMLLADSAFMGEALGEGWESAAKPQQRAKRHRAVTNGNGNGNGATKTRAVGKLGPPADRGWLERRRVELKMASRQFYRLVEMLMLRFVVMDGCDKRMEKAYRIWVKERLYRFNYEVLAQLDKKERQQKLDETFWAVRKDYERILAMVNDS